MFLPASPSGLAALAGRPGQPGALLDELARRYREEVGYAMLTMLIFDLPHSRSRRIYSSSPDTHPVGDYKPIPATDWVEHVAYRHEIFVADTVEQFRPHYTDWAFLQDMGLLSGVNFPIVIDGQAIGSVNLTAREEGYYTPARIAAASSLADLGILTLLLQERLERNMAQPA